MRDVISLFPVFLSKAEQVGEEEGGAVAASDTKVRRRTKKHKTKLNKGICKGEAACR